MLPRKRNHRTTLSVAVILTLLAILSTLSIAQDSALSPRQILDRMAAAYASCTSYRDEGKVLTSTGEVSFVTAFQRPAGFRFEYSRSMGRPERYVIWRAASGEAHSWWTIRPETRNQTMSLSIASAAGVSATSSHNIPRLLMPDETAGFSFALDNWVDSSVTEEAVNGRVCYKLLGHYPYSPTTPVALWVDKENYLVRKVASNAATVLYTPQMNVLIDQATFHFQPPLAIPAPQ